MNRHNVFIAATGLLFGLLAIVFVTFPRSTYSVLEKRDLARFPEFDAASLRSGDYTTSISAWFSDSEPYRDHFMTLHMHIRDAMALHQSGDDAVTFHAESDESVNQTPDASTVPDAAAIERANRDISDIGQTGVNAPAKVASAGIIVAGDEPNVRAMMVYKGEATGGKAWADMANFYHKTLGDDVRIYCMVIPTPIEYYCPEKVKGRTYRQLPTIRHIYSLLHDSIRAVDAYSALGHHAAEPIYFRTDHHWTPLGAYYAAQKLAEVAKVPFRTIDAFERHVRPGFVGTMYSYSKDIAVKRSPEDFVYYTPRDSSYTTTYRSFQLDPDFKIVSQSAPFKGRFFMPERFKGGASYSMFMGGDANVTKIETTGTPGRRLMIIKDSFGNALPPFLFGSFEQIHVIDHRYFIDNLADYIRRNGITDLVMINNIFNAYSSGVAQAYRTILTQRPQKKK